MFLGHTDIHIYMEKYIRLCPNCNGDINYKFKEAKTRADKKNSLCQSCCRVGDKNPFYNKKHSKESMLKMVETSKKSDNRLKYYEKVKSEEYRKYLSEKFKKNPTMKGNSYYKVWVKKYGKKIADNMNRECSLKKSHKGEKNYWFGKTPPFGSGNGWSGWYNGWYFRSLLELSYMVNIIEKYNIDWVSGEKNEYKIEYYHNNKKKNYNPDFILNGKYMIECKPKKMWNTKLVSIKKDAAEKFCKENNLIYKMRYVKLLTDDEILSFYRSGKIVWIERYRIKFENRILKIHQNKTSINSVDY